MDGFKKAFIVGIKMGFSNLVYDHIILSRSLEKAFVIRILMILK